MPVTLVDRLPLPNLKAYSAGSILLLSIAVYYAVNVTSDPNWKANATLQRQDGVESSNSENLVEATLEGVLPDENKNSTEFVLDVVTFMMQEPLCMWTLINTAYCALALFGSGLRRVVFGRLRVAEAARVRDKFWNYVFYKFIFVFGVLNVQYMDEVLLWAAWFTLVGFLHLLGHLCKDRFDYLSSSPAEAGWAHARLLGLLMAILVGATGLFAAALAWGLPAGPDTFAFMAAECALVGVSALHVIARWVLRARDADAGGPTAYYTHLAFDAGALAVEAGHVAHMVLYSNAVLSMASLVLLLQLRHLLHALLARLRRHRLYAALATHMSRNYPMASAEEVCKNGDNCAICWEPMREARKLPCDHLFHNSCLCRWVQQDASCPTCRRSLAAPAPPPPPPLAPLAPLAPLPDDPRHPNHLFHFDGSRYVSWLPSFSVEVSRARPAPLGDTATPPATIEPLEAMVRQVQTVFPQMPRAAVLADLAGTGSAHLTIHNILDGRLAPPDDTPDMPLAPAQPATSSSVEVEERTEAESGSDSDERFGESPAAREAALRRRRQRLLAAARRRFLARAPC
ncbi:E3 ubiquitin-protein ligase AMFR-like isoform X2 [Aricia agestis]|uniref:E3 ubiquitin-protein ligase AMFR-like isoform X2 n=1 Tax=Aricia agestis TaxID=91739 RepID=UPI001C20C019|nr:E3 ubiquitin-protein ligase AMFR-like isoform X2 [Aricia agestis]